MKPINLSNYLYKKIQEGNNYILAPRCCGKSITAVKLVKDHDYHYSSLYDMTKRIMKNYAIPEKNMVNINFTHNDNLYNIDKIVFDEFEYLNIDLQIKILEIYNTFPKNNWVFISSPRNNPLSIMTGKNDKGNIIQTFLKNNMKIWHLTPKKYEIIKKLNDL